MKKLVLVLSALFTTAFVFAGGIENKTNLSTGFVRNPSRNVEAERPEAAFYNIAGTGFMQDGLYAEIGNQFVFKEYSNSWNGIQALGVTGGKTKDNTPVLLYPDVDIVFKHTSFSVFADFGIYGGGGNLNYKNGTSLTAAAFGKAAGATPAVASAFVAAANNHSVDISSITYGGQVGVAFRVFDFISLAAAMRFAYGTQSMKLKADALRAVGGDTIEYKADGFSAAPVIGGHVRILEILDIAVQWQFLTNLKYTVKSVNGNTTVAESLGIKDGKTFRTDIPSAINIGVGVRPIPPLYLNAGFNYYFNKSAKLDSVLKETEYQDSLEVSLGVDYSILKNLGVSLGAVYSKQGSTKEVNNVFSPILDSVTIGCGIEFKPINQLTLTLAGMYSIYFEKEYELASGLDAKLNKQVGAASLGVTYKFF